MISRYVDSRSRASLCGSHIPSSDDIEVRIENFDLEDAPQVDVVQEFCLRLLL